MKSTLRLNGLVYVLGLLFVFSLSSLATDEYHLISGGIGSISSDFYYEASPPADDEAITGWDLISEPTTPITGPWGNRTGLFVPAPYGDYGLGRSTTQPTTYVQLYDDQIGICLDVQPGEIASQTYNPNIKYYYKWKMDYYVGNEGSKIWLYPYHTDYPNPNPRLRCSFEAAIKRSYGSGVRHANTAFHWLDEESGTIIHIQHYIYDSRSSMNAVGSGMDPKINQPWFLMKTGFAGAYHGLLTGSAAFTNQVWSDYEFFGIYQTWYQFCNIISYLNSQYNLGLGTNRDKWRLTSVTLNLEMDQGYEGCIAGKFKNMEVWTFY